MAICDSLQLTLLLCLQAYFMILHDLNLIFVCLVGHIHIYIYVGAQLRFKKKKRFQLDTFFGFSTDFITTVTVPCIACCIT